MTIELGDVAFDKDIVFKQLRNDLKDDWFPDPLGYSDLIEAGLIEERIAANRKQNGGVYQPSPAQLINIPKSNFTLRYALETSLTDRTIYHALASHLLPHYDKLILWRVYSHRLSSNVPSEGDHRSSERYTFRNGVAAWNDFLGSVRGALKPGGVLLCTDLANYFENIDLRLLEGTFRSLIGELGLAGDASKLVVAHIDQLFNYLKCWSYSPEKGLPQNRDASSFLANVYMRSVDKTMTEKGYDYYRYMDDIRIVCSDQYQARKALKELVLSLREIGQVVNSGKTSFIPFSESAEIEKSLSLGSIEMRRIDTAWRTKSLRPISRSFVPLRDLAITTMRGRGYDTKEFRYCISRLETLARCKEFAVPTEYFDEVTSLILDGLDWAPAAVDQFCRYLRAVDLGVGHLARIAEHLTSPDKTIYNWKNYRLWVLLAQKEHRDDVLMTVAKEIVRTRPDDATRAGATIYIGALGTRNDRATVAENFHSLSSYIGQRSAIIAVQELHYGPNQENPISIKTHVKDHVRPDLAGSYRAIRGLGKYLSPLEPISVTRYVDLERDYA